MNNTDAAIMDIAAVTVINAMLAQRNADNSDVQAAPAQLDTGDVLAAQAMGLIKPGMLASTALTPSASAIGLAYDKGRNIGSHNFASQQAVQRKWRDYAQARGFALRVGSNSTNKTTGEGNCKYVCKQINGQQPLPEADGFVCPFFVNAYGKNDQWKITKAQLCHNHYKHIGYQHAPDVESHADQAPRKQLRDHDMDFPKLLMLVKSKLFPAHAGNERTIKSKEVIEFLMLHGFKVNIQTAGRLKQAALESVYMRVEESYQKLGSYLTAVTRFNPGSHMMLEKTAVSQFHRAFQAAIRNGKPLNELFEWPKFTVEAFKATYSYKFMPTPVTETLQADKTLIVPAEEVSMRDAWTAASTKKSYRSHLNQISVWIRQTLSEPERYFDAEGIVDVTVFTPRLFEDFLLAKLNSKTIKVSTLGGYRSAVRDLYRRKRLQLPAEYQDDMKTFFSGMKRTETSERQAGDCITKPGKEPLAYSLYETLCAKTLVLSDGCFAHLFLTTQWNLMCRSNSVETLHMSHFHRSGNFFLQRKHWRSVHSGDQYLGRVVAGLPINSADFAILPPHFADQDADVLPARMLEALVMKNHLLKHLQVTRVGPASDVRDPGFNVMKDPALILWAIVGVFNTAGYSATIRDREAILKYGKEVLASAGQAVYDLILRHQMQRKIEQAKAKATG
ncbi:hypothetical protein ATCC90586_009809 [Pythium insidiosum]|nr:hypothetical protein ATCC90586_009809 [Pythium insidiosum]